MDFHLNAQTIFNVVFVFGSALVWAFLRAYIKNATLELSAKQNEELNLIRMDLINEYLKQSEFRYQTEKAEALNSIRFSEIIDVVNKIYNKLEHKADK